MIITFNTGRKYSEKGQRIAACEHENRIYFVDQDRGIEGVLNKLVELTEENVMNAYDRNAYETVFQPKVFKALASSIK